MPSVTSYASKDAILVRRTSDNLDLGAGKDHHLMVGRRSGGGYIGRGVISVPNPDWSGLGAVQMTSAILKLKVSTAHTALGGTPRILVRRLTETWNPGTWGGQGGGDPASETWSVTNSVVYPGPSATSTNEVDTGTISEGDGDVVSIDITDLWADILPAYVKDANGNAGDGGTNYGLRLQSFDEGSSSRTIEFLSLEGGYDPRVVFTYTTNQEPDTPTNLSPNGTVASADLTVSADWSDPDPGDVPEFVILTIATSNHTTDGILDTGIVLDAQDMEDVTLDGDRWTATYDATAYLTPGVQYYYQVYVSDNHDGYSASSTPVPLMVDPGPDVTPDTDAAVPIHNLDDPASWTSGGSHAKPTLSWTYAHDADLPQASYQVRIYSASIGGSELYDSGVVESTATSHDADYAMVRDSALWFTVEVIDSAGVSSGESARTSFKVLWGQAIYEYAVTGGTSSSQWSFEAANPVANTQHAFLFRTATGTSGAGASAWSQDIGLLTPAAYLNVMVRLATYASGTQPALADMTFRYIGSGVAPDHWTVAGTNDWQLVTDVRKYGTRSYRCAVSTTTGNRFIYPFRSTSGDDIPVTPGREYVFSAWVKTDAPLQYGQLMLAIGIAGSESSWHVFAHSAAAQGDHASTTDTSDQPDGWQRLWLTYTPAAGVFLVRPEVFYWRSSANAGDAFEVDAVQFEQSDVASTWHPGLVGASAILDAGGIAIDATQGGSLRLRSGDGTLVELGPHGLTFGTDVPVFSDDVSDLTIGDDTLSGKTIVRIAGGTSGGLGGTLVLIGNGAASDVVMRNVGGELTVDDVVMTAAPNITVVTSTDASWDVPDCRFVMFELIGGGGAGGSCESTTASESASAAGGGAGAYVRKVFARSELPATVSITIGAAGAAAAAGLNDGGDGGDTVVSGTGISTMTAAGGDGGQAGTGTTSSDIPRGGVGGTASGGDINIPGTTGGHGRVASGVAYFTGHGAPSHLGGGVAASVNAAGNTATAYGAGGSGAGNSTSQSARAGGSGAQGVVIVTTW
jgi:hypothetical protein